jgi:hypothetical protein
VRSGASQYQSSTWIAGDGDQRMNGSRGFFDFKKVFLKFRFKVKSEEVLTTEGPLHLSHRRDYG